MSNEAMAPATEAQRGRASSLLELLLCVGLLAAALPCAAAATDWLACLWPATGVRVAFVAGASVAAAGFGALVRRHGALLVLRHEIAHGITTLLSGGRILHLRASASEGGEVLHTRGNLLVSLAPYALPYETMLAVLVFREAVSLRGPPQLLQIGAAGIGALLAVHLREALRTARAAQPDLQLHGVRRSQAFIWSANVLLTRFVLLEVCYRRPPSFWAPILTALRWAWHQGQLAVPGARS